MDEVLISLFSRFNLATHEIGNLTYAFYKKLSGDSFSWALDIAEQLSLVKVYTSAEEGFRKSIAEELYDHFKIPENDRHPEFEKYMTFLTAEISGRLRSFRNNPFETPVNNLVEAGESKDDFVARVIINLESPEFLDFFGNGYIVEEERKGGAKPSISGKLKTIGFFEGHVVFILAPRNPSEIPAHVQKSQALVSESYKIYNEKYR